MTAELKQEFRTLVAAVTEHARSAQRRGVRWVAPPTQAAHEIVAQYASNTGDMVIGADLPREAPETALQRVRETLGDCTRCRLHEQRHNLVFGTGNAAADLVFVGEAPGYDEDREGIPFVGKAGQLLTKMIAAMGLTRDDVYIGNIIKCRPPKNRNPEPNEIATCEPFLRAQLQAIAPRIIVALGGVAAKALLKTDSGITTLRGRFHTYHGIPVMPTFHPAYLLRNPQAKRAAWNDLQQVMAEMDRLGLR